MEKIYMEENKRKRKSVVDFSVVLSFAVAFFAVFSLIAAGFDRVSYAAPVLDDNITFYQGKNSGGRLLSVIGKNDTDGQTFSVPLYYADSAFTKPVFCIEHKAEVNDNVAYSKKNQITDYGLLYLLNNSFVNNKNIIADPDTNKYSEAWATQVAIWVYLYKTKPENSLNAISNEEMSAIKAATKTSVLTEVGEENVDCDFGESIYDNYIEPLVNRAMAASNFKQISVTKADGEIFKTDDGKFYQTTLITVVGDPSSDLISYDISLSGIEGAIAVDENGAELALTNVAPGKKFYVRIPSDKVTDKVQNLQVGVTGHFKTLTGHEYHAESGNLQKVVTVTGDTMDVSGGLSIEIVGAPDTGMNTAQTIYFIGLIVLLCGVGIVYANAKPVDARQ